MALRVSGGFAHRGTVVRRVHQAVRAVSADTEDDELEMRACERCGMRVSLDEIIGHWDIDLCRACTDEHHAHYLACDHVWEPSEGEFGPGQHCSRCTTFIEDDEPEDADIGEREYQSWFAA